MEATDTKYEEHSFKSFLEKYSVIIPMVQRDYAQGRTTDDVKRVRSRFLNAIYDHLSQKELMKLDFVYGEINKVWSNDTKGKLDEIIVTPLDGQQRLTTLYLLHWFAARKAKVENDDYAFLTHFTYDIRPSSRDFCSHLIDFVPKDTKISEQIRDQHWFMAEWSNDPTILSMLEMLDAIKDKFSDIENLWKRLTEENSIVFYFLPLKENGLSDELYVKMNSRGKKLTPFEHFKAEFEALYKQDSEESKDINHRFDVEWIDVLFPYRANDNTVDKEFMRYFFYISHILCYQQSIKKENDEFELIKLLYDSNPKGCNPNPNAEENRVFLKKALDCWYEVKENGGIDNFFKKYLSCDYYEKGKVSTYKTVEEYRDCQNYFNACIKLYQVNNNFSYGDFLFLFGIITYLMNKDKVQEPLFIERLRVLRNLIMNSKSGEIRGDSDYMRDLLDEVSTLILEGEIKTGLNHSFNGFQENEEQEKLSKKNTMSQTDIERMYRFEDHPLIYGFVSGLGYDNLFLVDTFYSLFSSSEYTIIHRAMISIDDYRQYDNNRHYLGNQNHSTWDSLLHRSKRNGLDNTMKCLIQLLMRLNSGESLNDVINSFISAQEAAKQFSWRYYFAKYPDMVQGADGEFVWNNSNYSITTLNKHQFNGKHWDSFLNVIYKKITGKYGKLLVVNYGNYGENLSICNPLSSLSSSPQGFVYYHGTEHEDWNVPQDGDVDSLNRIEMAFNKIVSIIESNIETA